LVIASPSNPKFQVPNPNALNRRLLTRNADVPVPIRDATRVYGPRTTPVRLLWVAASAGALHTGRMTVAAAATAFLTGADGFVGRALIKVLRSLDHQVFALARGSESAPADRRSPP
jgi:hypothetical protein